MIVNESDATMAKAELNEAILLAKHVEKINSLKMDTRKAEAYQGGETESPGPDDSCARRQEGVCEQVLYRLLG